MEIRREIDGREVTIALTEAELLAAYQEKKRELDYLQVKERLLDFEELGHILELCGYSNYYLQQFSYEQLEKAENVITGDEELLLSIFNRMWELEEENPYRDAMDQACEEVLKDWGENHPEFLKQFESIEQKAYEKYKKAWLEERNYSEEFLAEIQKDYEEIYKEFGFPSCFEEYIDEHGYKGECYVCFAEFLDCEYQDAECMKGLLDEAEFVEYQKDFGMNQGSKEKFEIYTESKTFDDEKEINECIEKINKGKAWTYDALAAYFTLDDNERKIVAELQVPSAEGIQLGLKEIELVVYEYKGESEDFSNYTTDIELKRKNFNGDWDTVCLQLKEFAHEVSISLQQEDARISLDGKLKEAGKRVEKQNTPLKGNRRER